MTTVYLVALTRWKSGSQLETELQPLASELGLPLYEARLKLARPLPNILGVGLDEKTAVQRIAALHARGHGAVSCARASLLEPEQLPELRSIVLADGALEGIDANGRRFELPFAQLMSTLRALEQVDEVQTTSTKTKRLSVSRVVLTGGLMRNKTVTTVDTNETSERQGVAYLFRSSATAPLLLKETRLNYEGLGKRRGLTVRESFENLMRYLREVRPDALHDDRLLAHRRANDRTKASGVAAERVLTSSNAAANATAAQLIMLAHAQGQL